MAPMLNMTVQVKNNMPSVIQRVRLNTRLLLEEIGRQIVVSARRSIQHKNKAAAYGRPPRNVTGKLKAGIDFRVRNSVLSMIVQAAPTNPPKGSRKHKNVPKWLESNFPYIKPAAARVLARLPQILRQRSLTR